MRSTFFIAALICALTWSGACFADEMTDDSIKAFYKSVDESVLDPAKALEFAQAHTDEQLMVDFDLVLKMNGRTRKMRKVLDRAQTLQDIQATSSNKVEKAESTINKIIYSPDHKMAYVNNINHTILLIDIPTQQGQMEKAKATQDQTCLDQLILVDATLKFVRSQCRQTMTITR